MPRSSLFLGLLLVATPLAAAEETSARLSPSLDYIEIAGFTYLQQSEEDAPLAARREGEGGLLAFGWQASEFIALSGRVQARRSEPELGFADRRREDRQYELAMAFVAPFAESTRLLVELGLADEQLVIEAPNGKRTKTASSPGVFAAIAWRQRFGWFEYGFRTAGQNFHGARRQTHSADLRFHFGDSVALGLNYATWDRDFQRTERAGLGVQFKF